MTTTGTKYGRTVYGSGVKPYTPTIHTKGLWHLDGNSRDGSVFNNHGTDGANISYTTGKVGQGVTTAATSGSRQISIPVAAVGTIGTNDFTFAMWFYAANPTAGKYPALFRMIDGTNYVFAYFDPHNVYGKGDAVVIRTSTTAHGTSVTASSLYGKWTRIVFTRINGENYVYFNGVLVLQYTDAVSLGAATSFYIAGYSTGGLAWMPNLILDDFVYEDIGWTALQAMVDYNSYTQTAAGKYSPYEVYWEIQMWDSSLQYNNWINMSRYITENPCTADNGFTGFSALDRVASTGSLSFTLYNFNPITDPYAETTVGYFSPGHPNCRAGFDEGTIFRLKMSNGNNNKCYLRSKVNSIKVTAGVHANKQVQVTCSDFIDDIGINQVNQIPMQVNKTVPQAIATVIADMKIQPQHTDLPAGIETLTRSLMGLRDGRSSSLSAIQSLVQTDKGYFFMAGDQHDGETATYQTRQTRNINTISAVFDNSMLDLQVTRDTQKLLNKIVTTAHPCKTDAAAVILATLQREMPLVPGANPAFTMSFTDPTGAGRRTDLVDGTEVDPLEADTDFRVSSIAGNNGNDQNSAVTFAIDWGSNSASVVITVSGGATVYLNKLTLRGFGCYNYDPLQFTNESSASEFIYNARPFNYDCIYSDDAAFVNSLGAALLLDTATPGNLITSITFFSNDPNYPQFVDYALNLDIGQCVQIVEDVTSSNSCYYIQGMKRELMAQNILEVTLTNLELALTTKPFQLCAPGDDVTSPTTSILALYPNGDPSYTDTDPYGNKFHVIYY
jgi:hypothetical protein